MEYKVEGSVDGTEYTTIWDQSTNEVNAGSNGDSSQILKREHTNI